MSDTVQPMDCNPGLLLQGILQARIPGGLLCPPPRHLPDPGIGPVSCNTGRFFNYWASGSSCQYLLVPKVQRDQGPYLSLKFSSETISCQRLWKLFPLSPFPNGALPPSAQLQPGFGGPTLMFHWWLQAACSYVQTSEAGVQMGPPTSERPGEREVVDAPVFCSSLLSLPPWPFLTICQELFKHSEQRTVTGRFHSPESRECLPWFPESQKQVQLLPLGLLFRFKDSFYPT